MGTLVPRESVKWQLKNVAKMWVLGSVFSSLSEIIHSRRVLTAMFLSSSSVHVFFFCLMDSIVSHFVVHAITITGFLPFSRI
jgi:hypothetical protein